MLRRLTRQQVNFMAEALMNAYELTIYSWGALGLLLLVQLLVADILGIKSGHVPGTPPEPSHANALFRASRVVANTNESIAAYLVLVLFCIFSGADATYTAYFSWAYVTGRSVYAICYYFNRPTLRSMSFGITLLVLVGMLVIGVVT